MTEPVEMVPPPAAGATETPVPPMPTEIVGESSPSDRFGVARPGAPGSAGRPTDPVFSCSAFPAVAAGVAAMNRSDPLAGMIHAAIRRRRHPLLW